jgi:hypothetical protein
MQHRNQDWKLYSKILEIFKLCHLWSLKWKRNLIGACSYGETYLLAWSKIQAVFNEKRSSPVRWDLTLLYHTWPGWTFLITDFDLQYGMYYLQHERPCCIGYTNSSRRREFVYPIQHGRECCRWLKKRLILWVHWRSNFKNKRCLSRENQS